MDHYLWGKVKDIVYKNKPKTSPELKEKVKTTIEEIPESELRSVIDNFEKRLKLCREVDGWLLRVKKKIRK